MSKDFFSSLSKMTSEDSTFPFSFFALAGMRILINQYCSVDFFHSFNLTSPYWTALIWAEHVCTVVAVLAITCCLSPLFFWPFIGIALAKMLANIGLLVVCSYVMSITNGPAFSYFRNGASINDAGALAYFWIAHFLVLMGEMVLLLACIEVNYYLEENKDKPVTFRYLNASYTKNTTIGTTVQESFHANVERV